MAKDVYDRFNRGAFSLWKPKRLKSTMDKYLRIKKWNVLYAPEEEDIYWETLSNSKGARGYYYYKLKYFVVNLALLTFLLFLTTPCKCNIKIKLSIQFIVRRQHYKSSLNFHFLIFSGGANSFAKDQSWVTTAECHRHRGFSTFTILHRSFHPHVDDLDVHNCASSSHIMD